MDNKKMKKTDQNILGTKIWFSIEFSIVHNDCIPNLI